MSRFRFSLASLVGVVCAAAVVLGAWRYEPKLCGSLVAMFTMAVASAIVVGLMGNEASRRRWLPFAVFAGMYGSSFWLLWNEFRPSIWLMLLITGENTPAWPSPPVYAVAESVAVLLVGLVGKIIFHFNWKRHPPEGVADRPERREESP